MDHGVFSVRSTGDATVAVTAIDDWMPHVAIVDVEAPDASWLLARLRGSPKGVATVPAVALTPQGNLKARLELFERGIDDVLTLPFEPEELVARVIALLVRRTHRTPQVLQPAITSR